MLVDTHCHIQLMIKKNHNELLEKSQLTQATDIIKEAEKSGVSTIINIGASMIDNYDCIMLAEHYDHLYITVGLHPNDCSENWKQDIKKIEQWASQASTLKIVGIGECGLDKHYPQYDLNRQRSAFKAQIEIALHHNLALVVHSRDAYDETLHILEEYKNDITRAVMHCFSYDQAFAQTITSWNFMLGIGGTVTYPKNETLREVVQKTDLGYIVLETDAPCLPPQMIRGSQNHPKHIKTIAEFIAQLKNKSFDFIAQQTTYNALALFLLTEYNNKT